jgi:phosphoglycerate dehydrogenase-like enzyme
LTTVLYTEAMYDDDSVEREVFGPDVRVVVRNPATLAELDAADCAEVEGLMVFRHYASAADFAKFPRLRAVVRMGVGYDRLDRAACAARGITVCNVPDYGTMEVAEFAVIAAMALRRGMFLYHDTQATETPSPWGILPSQVVRRTMVQTFGIIGLGRIGTAAALRAKAMGFRVVFFDPNLPNGSDLALGIERARSLPDLLRQADVLSLHIPLTPHTTGLLGMAELSLLPKGAVVVNTARGPMLDIDALERLMRSDHIAGAALDVLPEEPPVDPVPNLLRAYRAREPWLTGRLVITPHAAFHSPQAWDDIRRKSAETMAAALGNAPQNVIPPESY